MSVVFKKYADVQEFLVKHGSSDSEFQEHTNLQHIL